MYFITQYLANELLFSRHTSLPRFVVVRNIFFSSLPSVSNLMYACNFVKSNLEIGKQNELEKKVDRTN